MSTQMNKEFIFTSVLMFVVITSGLDLYTDLAHGASTAHVIKEAIILLFASMLIFWILYEQNMQMAGLKQLMRELELRNENQSAMSEYIQGARRQLSEVIARQFDDWYMTKSEKEIGWLLLKGLSLKEISAIRDTHEKTVRQQASAIYKKADLNGRHAFSAWFIEDLF